MTFEARNLSEFGDVIKKIENNINNTLKTDIKEMVVSLEKQHAQVDVYEAYQPTKRYTRTYGLKNENNMIDISNQDNVIEIANMDEHDGIYVASVVETGEGYKYPDFYGYGYGNPRPFIENTINELKDKNLISKELKEGLKKRGLLQISFKYW